VAATLFVTPAARCLPSLQLLPSEDPQWYHAHVFVSILRIASVRMAHLSPVGNPNAWPASNLTAWTLCGCPNGRGH